MAKTTGTGGRDHGAVGQAVGGHGPVVPERGQGVGQGGPGPGRGARPKGPEDKVAEGTPVTVDGRPIATEQGVYVMLHKPAGVVSSTQDPRERTVLDLLPQHLRRRALFPVGRLDKDTEGLLLLTNDGPLAHALFGAGAACGQGLLCGGGRPAGPAGPAGLSGGSDPGRRDGVPAGGPDGAGPAQPGLG